MINLRQIEEFFCGFCYFLCEFFERYLFKFCDFFGGMNQQSRLIYFLLSHRFRRHIGTVCFNHHFFKRDNFCGIPCLPGIFECDNAGKRNIKTLIENNLCLLNCAAPAVKDDTFQIILEFIDNFDCFIEGISAVYNYRQIILGSDFEQICKKFFLSGLCGKIVMKIKPCFADGNDFFVFCKFFDLLDIGI